ncbi:MAG: hypothetical protein JSS83_08750 [Cyanobacteria bacterium SZAS LIN-3]|nr:hypothetical protein [Cyanobacteria bacterium SZAS LIN-3]
MNKEGDEKAPGQRASGRQARAMTRAIDMVSEEFIESFSQTGKDDGPEMPARPSPVREALAARDRREAEEKARAEADKPAFKGFGALLAGGNAAAEPEPATDPTTPDIHAGPGVQTTADGSVIKIKDTVGKKRGLYTSQLQKPSAEQIQEAAVKFSRPDARSQVSPPAEPPAPAAPLSPARAEASQFAPPAQAIPVDVHVDSPVEKSHIRRPAPVKQKMIKEESSCPFACAFGEFGLTCRRLLGWIKSVFEK